MNFKTTLVLIVLLAVAAAALYFTSNKGGDATKSAEATGAEKKLIDVMPEKVTKITVAPAAGDKFTLEKTAGAWHLSEPVSAAAESFEVDALVRAVVDSKSRGALSGADATSSATGLQTPAYRIDLTTDDGKTHTLNVGAKTAVGGNVYVSLGDGKEVHVVPVSLADQLEKPASDYRKTQLVDLPSNQVKQLTVTDKDGKVALKAEKRGEDWQLVEPVKMPAEKRDVDDMVFAATGLRAVEFVSENATADAAKYQLNKPQLTVSLSTEAPTTQSVPATTPTSQPAPKTITFGRHDDILKKNVYASVSGSSSVAKVAATVLESFNKKPLQLRDKRAVNIDPEQVSKLSFTADVAATTQPTSKPASKREVAVQRRKEALALGPAAPTTKPTSGPATTQAATTQAAATQPPPELSKWELVSDPKGEASDAKVTAILNALHPLRVEKYLESVPTTQARAVATYTINVTTQPAGGASPTDHLIRLTDRADQPLIGEYNGLVFELDRAFLRQLEGEFTKGAAPASASPSTPAGPNEPTPFPLGQ